MLAIASIFLLYKYSMANDYIHTVRCFDDDSFTTTADYKIVAQHSISAEAALSAIGVLGHNVSILPYNATNEGGVAASINNTFSVTNSATIDVNYSYVVNRNFAVTSTADCCRMITDRSNTF